MLIRLNTNKLYYITAVLMFLIATLPILRYAIPIPGLGLTKEICVILMTFYLYLYMIKDKTDITKNTYAITLMLVYTVYISTHVFINQASKFYALVIFKYHFLYILFFYAFYKILENSAKNRIESNRKLFISIIKVSVLIGSMVILIGLYEKFINPALIKSLYGGATIHTGFMGQNFTRIVSTIGNPIILGYYIIIVSLLCIFLARIKVLNHLVSTVFILSGMLVILFTLSRAAYLIVAALTALYMLLTFTKTNFIIRFVVLGGTVLYIFTKYDLSDLEFFNHVLERFEQIDTATVARDGRLVTWTRSLKELSDNLYVLPFGFGLGRLGWDHGTFVMENSYLAIIYEFGLMGFGLYMLILFKFFYNSVTLFRSADKFEKELGLLLVLFISFFMMSMLVSDSHMGLPQVFYFWFLYVISELFYMEKKYGN